MKRFFRSRGFLKFVLWTITLIVLFYAEEDWRGAHAWAVTKAKWEARGESFDLNKFFPAPIPDAQNLGALPIFQLQSVPYDRRAHIHLAKGQPWPSYLDDGVLRKTLESVKDYDFHLTGNWTWGQLPDMEKLRAKVSADYAETFKVPPPSRDSLAQFNALYPFLGEIRAAAASRPYCQFAYDDKQALPAARAMGLITSQIKLAKILNVHAFLALDQHQSDLALADFATIMKLRSGTERDPSLVAGLVSVALFSVGNGIIYDGLVLHTWNDAQLVEINHLLAPLDPLAIHQFAMRSEVAFVVGNFDYFKKGQRTILRDVEGMSDPPIPDSTNMVRAWLIDFYSFLNEHWAGGYLLWPEGWFDQCKSSMVDSILRETGGVDIGARRIYPEVGKKLEREIEQNQKSTLGWAPWNVLATLMLPPGDATESSKFGLTQARIDQTRIACALERYRLAHQVYPPSLDPLVPEFIASLPHDVINGQPYRYRLNPDGMFLLYSVGWNEKDDDGATVYLAAVPGDGGYPRIDEQKGDWVWPAVKTEQPR